MAISLVQTVEHFATTSTTNIVPIAATASGHLITICIGVPTSLTVSVVFSISDNLGSTYVSIPGSDSNTTGVASGMFYLANCASGITSITVTSGPAVTTHVYVSEWSGIAPSLPLDQSGHNNGTASGVNWSGPTLITVQPTELILNMATAASFALTSIDSPYTQLSITTGSNIPMVGYQLVSVTGSYPVGYHPHTAVGRWASSGASFIGSTGPSAKQKASTNLIF